jgi:hypothetical protein
LVEDAVAVLKRLSADQRDAASARLLTELTWRAEAISTALRRGGDGSAPAGGHLRRRRSSIGCRRRPAKLLSLDLLRRAEPERRHFFALAEALDGSRDVKVPPMPVVAPPTCDGACRRRAAAGRRSPGAAAADAGDDCGKPRCSAEQRLIASRGGGRGPACCTPASGRRLHGRA